jgi:hypothetical protein
MSRVLTIATATVTVAAAITVQALTGTIHVDDKTFVGQSPAVGPGLTDDSSDDQGDTADTFKRQHEIDQRSDEAALEKYTSRAGR